MIALINYNLNLEKLATFVKYYFYYNGEEKDMVYLGENRCEKREKYSLKESYMICLLEEKFVKELRKEKLILRRF